MNMLWSLVEQFVKIGTQNYNGPILRRVRLINIIILLFFFFFSLALIISSFVLIDSGLSPFSFTNLSIICLLALLPVSLLLHRFSEFAAAFYLLAILGAAVLSSTFVMGKQQGMNFGFITLAALAPCLIGMHRPKLSLAISATMIVLFQLTEQFAPEVGPGMKNRPSEVIDNIRLMATSIICVLLFIIIWYAFRVADRAETALEAEYNRSETLLRNILPEPIALRLKEIPGDVIADRHDEVTVLFADIVDFTPRAMKSPPEQVVDLLNRVFSKFDALAEKHRLEKIKTVGDAYMIVAGIPEAHQDGPTAMAKFALEMMNKTEELSRELGETIDIRVGIHTGNAVAGVIGTSKFAYDIWGDTVNTAARMEAFGVPGRIQVSEVVKDALGDRFILEERGIVDIKGKGKMKLYYLEGETKPA